MLSGDFREFVQLLNENEVRYLVAGGYAVVIHGYPRFTGDIDIWLHSDADNAARLLRALEAFGLGSIGLTVDALMSPDQVIQLGYPPQRIDLLTSLDGVEFDDCYERRYVVEFEAVPVPFIGLDDLKKNKRATGRLKDQLDLENL